MHAGGRLSAAAPTTGYAWIASLDVGILILCFLPCFFFPLRFGCCCCLFYPMALFSEVIKVAKSNVF